VIDYLSCILFRIVGFCIRYLPVSFSLYLGRRFGDLLYYFDLKHRAIAYANIKTAFGQEFTPREIRALTHGFYRNFGQNLIEIFFIPSVDKKYIDKYISFEGLQYIDEAFRKKKGVILLGVHAGSWELSNIICANLGFPFSVFVREQKLPHLNKLLNSYRRQKGCKLIERENQTRQLIEALKNNEAVGLTADQGGKTGESVKFFGKDASMAMGAVKLAFKYDSVILPAYYARVKGPYIKTIIEPPFLVKKTSDPIKDIKNNLQELFRVYEKNIRSYPKDYLWTYKIWKYTNEKNVLILNDSKAGHLRQAQAVAKILSSILKEEGITANINTLEVKFKSVLAKNALTLSSCFSGKYNCQGCLWCLRKFLQEDSYRALLRVKPDFIISCGSSLSAVNYILCRENLSKSIVIMRPSVLSAKRFDLVIMPKHDHPPSRRNIVVTTGALNLIDGQYLKEQSEKLIKVSGFKLDAGGSYIGLLIGGDAKNFSLTKEIVRDAITQIKSAAEKLNADILVSSSRRTSKEIEKELKSEFGNYSRCKLLIIANEKNILEAVGGILGLSKIAVVTPESISMVSEAAASGCYSIVFEAKINKRHDEFLRNMADKGYIHLSRVSEISLLAQRIWKERPRGNILEDNSLVKEAIKRIA